MAKILNFGSLNIDYVYQVDHFVRAGETLASQGRSLFPGGKGLNQSVALAKAGGEVYHAGKIGADGKFLAALMQEAGVRTELLDQTGSATGQAIIQVNGAGQNCILLHHGANYEITGEYIERVLSQFGAGDILVLQNEINQIGTLIERAFEKGMRIAFNPSPIDSGVKAYALEKISWFLMNEIEGRELTGESEPERIVAKMAWLYPRSRVVLTIGKAGVLYQGDGAFCAHGTYRVSVVDTTAAGDTFTGFFISSVCAGKPVEEALRLASVASSIAVSRKGAAVSIPALEEVLASSLTPA